MTKTYKCIFCGYKTNSGENSTRKTVITAKRRMGQHYEEKHKELLPEDMDGYRWFYYQLTKKERGSCVICKKPTEFNRITMKYSRFCNDPSCKQKYKEERDKRMMGTHGTLYVTKDPEFQKKMLAARKISGVYNWSDGKTKIPYTGSYELDFLRYLDTELHWPSSDIIGPSPNTYVYKYQGEDHFYMPDFFIPSLACEIEIKSSIRMDRQNSESKEKEVLKDAMMRSNERYINYIIIFDKNYEDFVKLIKTDDH